MKCAQYGKVYVSFVVQRIARYLSPTAYRAFCSRTDLSLTTARRELQEETGAEATHWQPLGAVLPSPGCYGEVLHLYLARGLTFGATHPDADEFLQVRRLPFDTLLARCLSGEIEDGKTVAAVLKAKLLGL